MGIDAECIHQDVDSQMQVIQVAVDLMASSFALADQWRVDISQGGMDGP